MKGLILKDIYGLKSYGMTFPFLILFFLVIGILQSSMVSVTSMMSMLIILIPLTASLNSLSLDQSSRWDLYAFSTSLRRRTVVLAKYLLYALLPLLVGMLMFFLCYGISLFLKDNWEPFSVLAAFSGVAIATLLFLGILFPIVYKFGVERARFMIVLIALLPTVAVLLLQTVIGPLPEFSAGTLPGLTALLWIAPAVILVFYYVSYRLSVHIVEKKDM